MWWGEAGEVKAGSAARAGGKSRQYIALTWWQGGSVGRPMRSNSRRTWLRPAERRSAVGEGQGGRVTAEV